MIVNCCLLLLLLIILVPLSAEDDTDNAGQAVAQLLMACMVGEDSTEVVLEALDNGADINILDNTSGQTPLMAAILRGKSKIVKVLLEEGADVTIADNDGYTPAHGAAVKGSVAVTKVLEKFGVDVKTDKLDDGYYPFHRACMGTKFGHRELVEYFLLQGVNPDLEAGNGKTCIELATNKKIKRMLILKGADPRGENSEEL
mmetsp:Transcript_15319/g.17650  ORF Transcript_15319/g.17650 Transcript_15319/m.17650 type:complete len:201 (-) Transcript_15319:13-615(-)